MRVASTLRLEAAESSVWDVVVVGAGPAGAATAYHLALAGCRVLVVDRAAFPRHKVCGGCISARTLEDLGLAGLLGDVQSLGGLPVRSLRLGGWRHRADIDIPAGMALSRWAFDAALLQAAVNAGAEFVDRSRASLGAITDDYRSVELERNSVSRTIRARVVVDASGLGGRLAPRNANRGNGRVGVGAVAHIDGASYRAGVIHMAVGRHGYVGLVRLEDHALNVAASLSADAMRRLGATAVVAGVLEQAGFDALPELGEVEFTGTPQLGFTPRRRGDRRLFAVGDAAGYVEPFTGEGMGWAVASAGLAAPLVARAADSWSDDHVRAWEIAYRRELLPAQRWCRALSAGLRRPWMARPLLAVVANAPRLASPLVRAVHAAPRPTDGLV